MGLSLEFYAGDAAKIGAAFTEAQDLDSLRDGSKAIAYADLSLHLAVDDLDLLSEALALHAGAEPRRLQSHLESEIGLIDGGSGGCAYLVAPGWVDVVASADAGDARAITARWFELLADVYNDGIDLNDGAIAAVASLIRLCRTAVERRASVVFTWYW